MLPPCFSRVVPTAYGPQATRYAQPSGKVAKPDLAGIYESAKLLNSQDSNFTLHLRRSFESANSPHLIQDEYLSLYCGFNSILNQRCQYASGLAFSSLLTGSKLNHTWFIASCGLNSLRCASFSALAKAERLTDSTIKSGFTLAT